MMCLRRPSLPLALHAAEVLARGGHARVRAKFACTSVPCRTTPCKSMQSQALPLHKRARLQASGAPAGLLCPYAALLIWSHHRSRHVSWPWGFMYV